jgi:hypothetical protein
VPRLHELNLVDAANVCLTNGASNSSGLSNHQQQQFEGQETGVLLNSKLVELKKAYSRLHKPPQPVLASNHEQAAADEAAF